MYFQQKLLTISLCFPQPRIGGKYTELESEWKCPECAPPAEKRNYTKKNPTAPPSPRKSKAPKSTQSQVNDEELDNKHKLPYDVSGQGVMYVKANSLMMFFFFLYFFFLEGLYFQENFI